MPPQTAYLNALIQKMFGRVLPVLLLMASSSICALAEEDPYLSALSREALKVEAENQPTLSESDAGTVTSEEGSLDLQAFEEDLKARYKGSFTFYQKLPRRTREEVFLEYRDGASIDEIRKKIMDRFLHQ